jgi:transcriptional regulator of acetoin/glycerol metabolism
MPPSLSSPSEHPPIGRDAQRAVESRWRATVIGGSVPDTLRPIVRDSWARSLESAVPPTLTHAPLVWDDNAVQVAREHADWFLCAQHILEAPDSAYASGDHVLTLFDAAGRMLDGRGDPHALDAVADINFRPGALWSESVVGTCGPGTALASGRAVHIVGAEHFCEKWQAWHCAAVPIRDPVTMAIVGVLDISGFRDAAHPHTLALAGTLAAAVEQMLAAHESQRRVTVLRTLATLLGRWPADGLAAVDRGGAILGAAGPLPHALQPSAEAPEAAVRHALIDAVRRAGEAGRPLEVQVPIGDGIVAVAHPVFDGARVIGACLVVPRRRLPGGRTAFPSPPARLADCLVPDPVPVSPIAPATDARDDLIAVVRAAETMTAAARVLGITRSTLYRRMAHYGLRPGRALNDGPP